MNLPCGGRVDSSREVAPTFRPRRAQGLRPCPTRTAATPGTPTSAARAGSVFENATTLIVELRFGEGGADAKAFVSDLREMYERYAVSLGLSAETVHDDNGHAMLEVAGRGVWDAFRHEPGKHVVQRVPANERGGRRQTSVVSVAVLPLPPEDRLEPLRDEDVEVITQTGKQKAGGQNVNKVASAVRMRHVPTGASVFINGRDQGRNRKTARYVLTARVNRLRADREAEEYDDLRSRQMRGDGDKAGGRGDKVRTYNLIESRVIDHRLGVRMRDVKAVLKGELGKLFGGEAE